MGSLYLGGPTIQEVDGKMMMGLSIYGVAVISGSLYSRFYGISVVTTELNIFILAGSLMHSLTISTTPKPDRNILICICDIRTSC